MSAVTEAPVGAVVSVRAVRRRVVAVRAVTGEGGVASVGGIGTGVWLS